MSTENNSTQDEEVTVRALKEDPNTIARFISEVYDLHPHGKSFVPRWSGAFLNHIIFQNPDFTPDHAIGAYQGERLVGLIMAQPHTVIADGAPVKSIYGSWLAVKPEWGAQFTAIRLLDELRMRHKAQGARLMLGVAYRSGPGVGLDFWESYARAFPNQISSGRDLKFWTRVLDGKALAEAVHDPLLKVGGQTARVWPVRQPKPLQGLRDYAADDLQMCQRLLSGSGAEMCTVPSDWELQSAPDLATGPQTLVIDLGSGVVGLSMFHVLPMSDAKPLYVGMIDHFVCEAGSTERNRLMAATLWRLKQAGACLALMPRKPHIKSGPMLMSGFVPYEAEFKTFLMPIDDDIPCDMPASYDLLVR